MNRELFDLHGAIEESHWWFVARRRIMRQLVYQAVPPEGRPVIVDVGCGTGANVATLATDYSCVGVDSSQAAIEIARRRFPDVRFVCGVAPNDVADDCRRASMFLLMDVIEHVPDDFALLSEILAASRPGAQVLITVPAHESLWSEHDVSFGHYRRYDARRLARVWQGLPVTVRLLSYYNARLFPLIKVVRTLAQLRGKSSGAAGTDFDVPATPINRALTRLFAGEATRLRSSLVGGARGYRTGVSLVAVLRREPGEIAARTRPPDVTPDTHRPERT